MYTIEQLSGTHLPPKTLCLTYDDGPGIHTLPIAQFLYEQGIRATFFVVGKYAVEQSATLAALKEMGHLIANHTFEHPDMPYYVSINGDVQDQLLRTDAAIKHFTDSDKPIFFRAPYGKWSAEVANELNSNLLCAMNHAGPVHWDIAGIDCYYWLLGKSVAETVESYLTTIRETGKGIVVMHDEIADMDVVKPLNKTLELTQQLIPLLKAEGYRFVGLDEVYKPEPTFQIRLQAGKGKYLCLQNSNAFSLTPDSKNTNTLLNVTDCSDGKVALQAANACYLSLKGETEIVAIDKEITYLSTLHLVPVFNNQLILRTYNGNFLTVDKATGKLTATAKYMRLATVFSYQPAQAIISKPVSLQMRYQLWKKRLAFVKSKLLG